MKYNAGQNYRKGRRKQEVKHFEHFEVCELKKKKNTQQVVKL